MLPPIVDTARVLRLDSLNLGELDASGLVNRHAYASIGYNLDGLCTAYPADSACTRVVHADPKSIDDGVDGIDNSFGRHILPFLLQYYTDPSPATTGSSYLALEGDGRATLYIGSGAGVQLVIPLVNARLSPPRTNGVVTLAAIAPREAFVDSARKYMRAFGAPVCGSSWSDSVAETIRQAADIPISGVPAPTMECDGVSLAIEFIGTPVAAAPALPLSCEGL